MIEKNLNQRIASAYKESNDEIAGRWKSHSDCRAALKAGHWQWAPWIQRSCVWPDETLVDLVISGIVSAGCQGLTSLGCGSGLLEYFLAEKMKPMSIRGFDLRPLELQLLPEATRWISYGQLLSPDLVVHIPQDDALLISWGELPHWEKYLETFQDYGRCLILIVDDEDKLCIPSIHQVSDYLKIGQPCSNWYELIERFHFENKLGSYQCTTPCKISIFLRKNISI